MLFGHPDNEDMDKMKPHLMLAVLMLATACSDSRVGTTNSPPEAAPEITIDAPTAEGVYFSNFPVLLQATVSDAEDLPTELRVSWAFDGGDTIVEGVTPDSAGSTTNNIDFWADTYSLVATVTDTAGNTRTATVSFVVGPPNSAPTAPVVSISPSAPVALTDDLVCSIDTASTDADNDTITYTFMWEVDTVSWTGSTSTTSQAGDTIAASDLTDNEEWTCIVTPYDGTDSGPAGEASVTVNPECGGTLTDVDGNTYPTVEIGSQCWMGTNLNTTQDANGASVSRWCCDCNQYGGMYDWWTAMNGSSTAGAQGICPNGWHVPSDADWFVLEGHIDPSMTDPNYIGWSSTTIGDQLYLGGSYGFDWITGGFSYGGDDCSHNDDRILYWSSSDDSFTDAISRLFNTAFPGSNRDIRGKIYGYYVRCLKD